jgi:hypothetical protein
VYRRFEGLQYPRNAHSYSPFYSALHRRLKHPCFWNTTLCRVVYRQNFPKGLLHSSSEHSKPSSWTTIKMEISTSETTATIHDVINSHLNTRFSDYRQRKHLILLLNTQFSMQMVGRSYSVTFTFIYLFLFFWRYNPLWVCILQPSSGAIASSRTRFRDHTRRATVGRTPLDE